MADEQLAPSRLINLFNAFGVFNQVMSIAEIETIKAAVFEELGLTIPVTDESIENLSPLSMVTSAEGLES